MPTKHAPKQGVSLASDSGDLAKVAEAVWPSLAMAMDAIGGALGTVSASYLAVVQAKPAGMTLAEIRKHVPQEWQARTSEASFLAQCKLASSFLAMHGKAIEAKTKVQGQQVDASPAVFLARFGTLERAKVALRDALSIPKQVKQGKATKATPKATKVDATRRVDVNGQNCRNDVLQVFTNLPIVDAVTLLAQCADLVQKRQAKQATKVTSKRPSKATK